MSKTVINIRRYAGVLLLSLFMLIPTIKAKASVTSVVESAPYKCEIYYTYNTNYYSKYIYTINATEEQMSKLIMGVRMGTESGQALAIIFQNGYPANMPEGITITRYKEAYGKDSSYSSDSRTSSTKEGTYTTPTTTSPGLNGGAGYYATKIVSNFPIYNYEGSEIIYQPIDYDSLDLKITSPADNKYIANNSVEYVMQATLPQYTTIDDFIINYYDDSENLLIDTELNGIERDKNYITNSDGTLTYTWKYDVVHMKTGQQKIRVRMSYSQGYVQAFKTVNVIGTNFIECYYGFTQDKTTTVGGTTTYRVNWQTDRKTYTVGSKELELDLKNNYRVRIYDTNGLVSGFGYNQGTRKDGQVRTGTEQYNVSFSGKGTTIVYADLQYCERGLDMENASTFVWKTICTSKGQEVTIESETIDTNGDGIDDNTNKPIPDGEEYLPGTNGTDYGEENTTNWDTTNAISMLKSGWQLIQDSCYEMQGIVGVIFGFLPEPVVYLLVMLFTITICATIVKIIRG